MGNSCSRGKDIASLFLQMIIRTNRIDYLDSIAGLLIIVMIAGHCGIIDFGKYSVGQLFSFYMGWFFFKSGMFHKCRKLTTPILLKWYNSLIKPFVSFTLLALILPISKLLITGNTNYTIEQLIIEICNQGASYYNIPLWFLTSIFIVKVLSCRLNKSNWYWWVCVSLSIALFHNLFFDYYQFSFIGNIALGVTCYTLGYVLCDLSNDIKAGICFLLIYLILQLIFPSCINFFRNHNYFGNYYIAIIGMIPAIIGINTLFKNIKFLNSYLLNHFGRESIKYLVIHYPLCLIFRQLGGVLCFIIVITICLVMIYFTSENKRLNWLIGRA